MKYPRKSTLIAVAVSVAYVASVAFVFLVTGCASSPAKTNVSTVTQCAVSEPTTGGFITHRDCFTVQKPKTSEAANSDASASDKSTQ